MTRSTKRWLKAIGLAACYFVGHVVWYFIR